MNSFANSFVNSFANSGIHEFARRIPKVDVHCHLTGSLGIDPLLELCGRHARSIDVGRLRDAYDVTGAPPEQREGKFFDALDIVASLLTSPEDLEFAVYSIARDGARRGNLRYLEMFVNPTALARTGMSFAQIRDGLVRGSRSAYADHRVVVRFIVCVLRDEPTSYAEQLMDDFIEYRTDDFIGIGLDGPELLPQSPAERFAAVYQRAGKAGFRRTAHLTETPPESLFTCLDSLGCDRIDHGYPVTEDATALRRAVDSGVFFTCCLTITRDINGSVDDRYRAPQTHPTTHMMSAGLPIVLGTDDGALVGTNIGDEYALAAHWYGWGKEQLMALSMRGLDAAWIDDAERSTLRAEFAAEFERLS